MYYYVILFKCILKGVKKNLSSIYLYYVLNMSKYFSFFICMQTLTNDGFCNVAIAIDSLSGLRQNPKAENGELLDVMDVTVTGSDSLPFITTEA